jgi:hypothetical protein
MNQLLAPPPRRYAGKRHEKPTMVSGKTGALDGLGEVEVGVGDVGAPVLAGELGETDAGALCEARPDGLAPHALMTAVTARARICRITSETAERRVRYQTSA